MTANPPQKHLVLLGAGRAHLQVLKGLARQGSANIQVSLVAPHPYYIELNMLPGYVGGEYMLEDIRLPLDALVEASGASFIPAHVVALDPMARRVQLSTGDALPYDVLSVDVEPVIDRDRIEAAMPGARRNALFTYPLENFVQLWPQVLSLARQRALQVAVIGEGLTSAELAMSVAQTIAAPHGSRITLLSGEAPLLNDQPSGMQKRIRARLKALDITVLQDYCVGMDSCALQLASGASLVCDAPILTAGEQMPTWLVHSGLHLNDAGALLLNPRLQSESHRQVFVVPPYASAEVGMALEANLRTAISGGNFRSAPTQAPRLKVINCGDGCAIAAWGPLSLEGREVWNWKDRRDRRHLAALFDV